MSASLVLRRTPAYRRFRDATKQNNHFLTTTLIALDRVEQTDVRPDPLFSSRWAPRDRAASARRSRSFVLEASLNWMADQISTLSTNIRMTPGLSDVEWAERAPTPSTAVDNFAVTCDAIVLPQGPDYWLVRLGIMWRDILMQPTDVPRPDLEWLSEGLAQYAGDIADSHRGLSVERALADLASAASPTFKAVTSVIDASQGIAAQIDRVVVSRVAQDDYAEAVIRRWVNGKDARTTIDQTWNGDPAKTLRRLRQLLLSAGFAHEERESLGISEAYLDSLIRLSRTDASARFEEKPAT